MSIESLISLSEQLHSIIGSNSDLLDTSIEHLKKNNAIDTPEDLKKAFLKLQEKDRVLNIGIVGRVKAGKSSLLNALIFDGESILPKSATPMTAALTTLNWGEKFQAEVEFFSKEDIESIQKGANEYESKLKKKIESNIAEYKEKLKKKSKENKTVSKSSPEERATRQAESYMKSSHPELCSLHDQNERMKKSGISLEELEGSGKIDAANPGELAKKLQEFVGADGKFMPFSRAVHIYMPLDELKDICIIDTPGMNDPVISREKRTVKELKKCDVIFIVSPAGQFLNEQDMEVIGRITEKEGVQKIILVASQLDMQLYGKEMSSRLEDTLEIIQENLSGSVNNVFSGLREKSPEIGSIFDAVIESPKEHLLVSSGLCHSLAHTKRDSWDSNEQHTWKKLCSRYPDYFSDKNFDVSRTWLDKLANISRVHEERDIVRQQKDEIQKAKIANLSEQQEKGLRDFQEQIVEKIGEQINRVGNTTIESLKTQLQNLSEKRAKLTQEVDKSYSECVAAYQKDLNANLVRKHKNIFEESQDTMSRAEGTTTEKRERDKSGFLSGVARFFGVGGRETVTETVTTVATARMYSCLKKSLIEVEDQMEQAVTDSRIQFDKALSARLTPAIGNILGSDGVDLDMLIKAIRDTVDAVPEAQFSLGISIPKSLKSQGTLKGYSAERYRDEMMDFLYEVDTQSREKIRTYMKEMGKKLPKPEFISNTFIETMEKDIEGLKKQIENKAQTIDRLKRMKEEIEGISYEK